MIPPATETTHKFSFGWFLLLVICIVASSLLLGSVFAAAVHHGKGSLLTTYRDKAFGISFLYPAYDSVTHYDEGEGFATTSAAPVAYDPTKISYESDRSSVSQGQISMDISNPYTDEATQDEFNSSVDYVQDHCTTGASSDGSTYHERALTATFTRRNTTNHQAVVCRKTTSSSLGSGDTTYSLIDVTYDAYVWVPGRGIFNVSLLSINNDTAEQEHVMAQMLDSIGSL